MVFYNLAKPLFEEAVDDVANGIKIIC
jgi:hypothetical protein